MLSSSLHLINNSRTSLIRSHFIRFPNTNVHDRQHKSDPIQLSFFFTGQYLLVKHNLSAPTFSISLNCDRIILFTATRSHADKRCEAHVRSSGRHPQRQLSCSTHPCHMRMPPHTRFPIPIPGNLFMDHRTLPFRAIAGNLLR